MDLDKLELPEEARQALQAHIADEAQKLATPIVEETVQGLKNKNSELLGKLKDRDEAMAQLQAQQEKAQTQPANDEVKQLNKALEQKVEDLVKRLEEKEKAEQVAKLNGEAGKLAAMLTKDPRKGGLLQKEIVERLTLVEGEVKVLDELGQVSAMTIQELEGSVRNNYDFLVDGSQAQGGGAVRSEGEAQKPMEMSRDEFRSRSASEKMSFIKSGGTIIE